MDGLTGWDQPFENEQEKHEVACNTAAFIIEIANSGINHGMQIMRYADCYKLIVTDEGVKAFWDVWNLHEEYAGDSLTQEETAIIATWLTSSNIGEFPITPEGLIELLSYIDNGLAYIRINDIDRHEDIPEDILHYNFDICSYSNLLPYDLEENYGELTISGIGTEMETSFHRLIKSHIIRSQEHCIDEIRVILNAMMKITSYPYEPCNQYLTGGWAYMVPAIIDYFIDGSNKHREYKTPWFADDIRQYLWQVICILKSMDNIPQEICGQIMTIRTHMMSI